MSLYQEMMTWRQESPVDSLLLKLPEAGHVTVYPHKRLQIGLLSVMDITCRSLATKMSKAWSKSSKAPTDTAFVCSKKVNERIFTMLLYIIFSVKHWLYINMDIMRAPQKWIQVSIAPSIISARHGPSKKFFFPKHVNFRQLMFNSCMFRCSFFDHFSFN